MSLIRSTLKELDHLGRSQYGLSTRDQLLPMLGADRLQRLLAAERLEVVHPTVYRHAGAPVTPEQRLLAAVLAVGPEGLASHRSAAWLWRLLPDRALPIEPEITVPHPRMPRLRGVIVHRSLDLHAERASFTRGIPVTHPLLTVLHLGVVVGQEVLEDAVDLGLQRRMFTIAGLEALHGRFGRRGRNGAGVLRRLLDERALGADRPDGLLEPRMARLLRDRGLPQARFQYEVAVGGRRYFIDFAYPDVKLAIEVDGYATRSSPRALQRHLDRQNDLVEAGWTVLRFTWSDVVRRPAMVARRIQRMLDELR
jgi:very-short-patch-repair endonuclease